MIIVPALEDPDLPHRSSTGFTTESGEHPVGVAASVQAPVTGGNSQNKRVKEG